jgi:uncharacterized protein (TIGR02217 family)
MGGPGWSTDIASLRSGDEQRNENWSRSRHEYEASHGIKTALHFKQVGAHFRMARGRLHHFRFKDWADFTAARGEGAMAMLTSTTYQLYKAYGEVEGFIEYRKITRPVSGTLKVWDDNVLTPVTVNYETGVVTFSAPPSGSPSGSVLECQFEFDVPVRYDTDKLQATLVSYTPDRTLHSWASVPLVEHRE